MSAISVYWASTLMLSLFYLVSAALYLTRKAWVRQVLTNLRYPAPYLVPFIALVEVLAVAAILSRINMALSDLAYAGIFYHLLLSGLSHIGVQKPVGSLPAILGLGLLFLSFATQNTARDTPSPYAVVFTHRHHQN